jgi:methyl-accepting chemotaxis protein
MKRLGIMQQLMLLFCGMLVVSVGVMFVVNMRSYRASAMLALQEKARAITIEAENARQYMGDLRGKYKTFDDAALLSQLETQMQGRQFATVEDRLQFVRTTNFYWTIPIVAGWTVGQTNAQKANYEFRVPKIQPRNPKNEPNAVEREMLNELKTGNLDELYRIDPQANVLRYMRPIKLSENCMGCHGTVADDANGDGIDPLGFKMEGWKAGEIHGAFEVVADLTPLETQIRSNLYETLMVGGVILLLAVLVTLYFVRRNVTGLLTAVREVIVGLSDSTAQVSTATQQMTSAGQSLAEGASEQAASLEETASSLEEMASVARQNAESASQADTLAAEAGRTADMVAEAMTRMIDSIGAIKRSADQTALIIRTIDEIAFQTNLLALNAAVEAARAGDAGRGFAVVAEEVRNLAQRSAEAARNTAELIDDSQTKADGGVKVASEMEGLLAQIITAIKKVGELVRAVNQASNEQARGVEQINSAVAQMDTVTQSNASNAEQTSATSQELAGQMELLNEMVVRLGRIVGQRHEGQREAVEGNGNGNGVPRPQRAALRPSRTGGNGHLPLPAPQRRSAGARQAGAPRDAIAARHRDREVLHLRAAEPLEDSDFRDL